MMDVLCPLCGLPASSIVVRGGIRLIGCPCVGVGDRPLQIVDLPLVTMTENHDPGDEDRS